MVDPPQTARGVMKASSENRAQRAISILLVFILHTSLIFALHRFMVSPRNSAFRMVPETRLIELIISTTRLREPRTREEAPKPALTREAIPPVPYSPQAGMMPPTVQTPTPNVRGFGHALVGCAPENLTNLDEEQRARCRKIGALASYDPTALDYVDRSDEVRGVKQWERELARKKAPLLLPCGNAKAFDFVYTGGCIIANIANGFTFQKQYENQPSYSDKSGQP